MKLINNLEAFEMFPEVARLGRSHRARSLLEQSRVIQILMEAMAMRFVGPFLSLILLPCLAWSYEDVPQARPSMYGSSKNMACPVLIRPGVGIGPIELGQDLRQIESTGLELKTVQGSTAHVIASRYSIQFNEYGKVHYVQAEVGDLPDCIYYGKLKINKSATVRDLMKVLPGCIMPTGLPPSGGTNIECQGISIGVGGWGGQQKTPTLKVLKQ